MGDQVYQVLPAALIPQFLSYKSHRQSNLSIFGIMIPTLPSLLPSFV